MFTPLLSLLSLADYLALPDQTSRADFEVFWFQPTGEPVGSPAARSWLCLVSLGRANPVPLYGQQGEVIRFTRDFLEDDDKEYSVAVFKLFNQSGEAPVIALSAGQHADLRAVYEVLAREHQATVPCFIILKALLKAFVMNLIRLQEQPFTPQDLQGKRVYQFLLLVEAHYASQTQVGFYAAQMGISPKWLNKILQLNLQKTATQLVHERLLLEAKRELTIQERTIKEIAFRLGFEEPSYFARFFRKHTGNSPTEFQEQMFQIVSGIAPKGSV
jgi:AraC family transcriptional activator of pobA